jgi:Pentapeptide repeats (8 copies)
LQTRPSLSRANLRRANLFKADLWGLDLQSTILIQADLTGANLCNVTLIGTWVNEAKISGSWIHGINVWDLRGEFEEQKDLIITPYGATKIAVDNIKIAQFIYLIMNNVEIRDVINTLTSKSVLILGRFTDSNRKIVLDTLRDKLRAYNLLPIVFDFDRPIDKDYTETVQILAGLSLFTIVDITSSKSTHWRWKLQ